MDERLLALEGKVAYNSRYVRSYVKGERKRRGLGSPSAGGGGTDVGAAAAVPAFDPRRYQLPAPAGGGGGGGGGGASRGGGGASRREEGAALRIQARARGRLARDRLDDHTSCLRAATRLQAAWRGMAARQQMGLQARQRRDAHGGAATPTVLLQVEELMAWRTAQDEAVRFLWQEVRALRAWKDARERSDAIVGQDGSPSAVASLRSEIEQMRQDMVEMRSSLVEAEERALRGRGAADSGGGGGSGGGLGYGAQLRDDASPDVVATRILDTFRLGAPK